MERRGVADWFFPSIGDVLFLSIFFWALAVGAGFLNDGDTGWHIVTGENIIKTMSVPRFDTYSHTMPGTPWTAHEWLSEVILALVHRIAGLNGVVLLGASVVGLTFFFLYGYLIRIKVNPFMAVIMTVIAAEVSGLHWLARPHIFSFPLTLAFIILLERYQREGTNRLRYLPLLMALWVNLHAGYILGLMLVLLYAGGNLLLYIASPKDKALHMTRFRALGIAALACIMAACLNPRGPAILYFPFHLVGRKYIMDNVLEWLSPNFHADRMFEFMLIFFVVVFVLSKKKPDVFEGGAALMLTHMSLYSARYIPLMAIIVTPAVAARAGDALGGIVEAAPGLSLVGKFMRSIERISSDVAPLQERFNKHLYVCAALAACLLIAFNGGRLGNRVYMNYSFSKENFPVDAVRFALKNNIQGQMFNNDGWGGYIIYRAYPRYKVFFDGRSDMFGVPLMKEYAKVARAEPGYDKVLDKYHVNWVMYNAGSAINRLLAASGKWRLVYADFTAEILLRDVPENRALIEKFKYAGFAPKADQED